MLSRNYGCFVAVLDKAAAPRDVANQTRVTKLPTERNRLYVEVRGGDVPGKRPGRGGILLRQAAATPAAASAAAFATIATVSIGTA